MRQRFRNVVSRNRSVAIGLAAQVLQYGAALMLMPFIVTRLSSAEVGVWYVFVAVQGLASLADFGFQPTIARSFAAAYSGADQIQSQGLSESKSVGMSNLVLVAQILRASKLLYAFLAGLILFVLLTIGSLYIAHISRHLGNLDNILIAWLFFSASVAFNIYFLWVDPLLIGAGKIAQNYAIIIINRGSFAAIGLLSLLAGGGLIALAVANVLSVFVARLVAVLWLRKLTRQLSDLSKSEYSLANTLKALGPNAARMGLVALGAFFINRFSVLIISSYNGLSASASYSIAIQIFSAISAVSILPTHVALPQLVAYRIGNDLTNLRRSFFWRHGFMLVFFLLSSVVFIQFGQATLNFIGSNVDLLSSRLLVLLAAVMFLEANHSNCAFVITTGNKVPFVAAALLSGAGVVAGSVLLESLGFGLVGVIVAQGLVQLAYNNWKWPLALFRELKQ